MTNQSKPFYYASVIAKLPRKRKEERFEVRLDASSNGSPMEAAKALKELIATHGLRGARCAQVQLWHGSETEFVDASGQTQVMVFRNIFPSGSAIAVDLA